MFRNLTYLLLAAGALIAGVMLYQLSQVSAEPKLALVYPQPRALADFNLTDHHGETVNRERLYGQWTLAFVGYTSCPDICPLTLAKLAGAQPKLAEQVSQPLKVWFISVDPNRDSIEQLNRYVSYFEQASVLGMTAGHDQLFPFVRQLGLMYALSSSTSQDYLVDHSASVVLINPQGQLVAMFKPPMQVGELPVINVEQLLADFPLVLNKLNAG
ncbi:SCO family protein [Rheinheimera baltica]|uniref:SCO family protein n=1 Tax=Rheinheimera baltica TaxID=67576 RepID=A0ABT9I0B1_9GAMM|nr:SCO family protein [Rheinheimera baltica]MDP5136824.1 SCO family protein [Rheinheimera baltica]MDP5142264.1 SCO family protein [Rheinheimera baltica]MDP5150830.1 SCO family protein [Rheinheimera baltica]MDP5188635.1 SCO family protein [Rheinheimera baltica]